MHSLIIAALAAAAAATPLSVSSYPTNVGYASNPPAATGSYYPSQSSWTTSYTTEILGNPTAAPNPVPSKGTIANLLTQDNRDSRWKEIRKEITEGNLSPKFDFNPAANPNVTAGEGGQVDLASRANFPMLTDLGISSATIFFQPCGLNTPHMHPLASEFLTLVSDTKMMTGFVLDNGVPDEFNTTLTQYQGTVFPMGSIHYQQNLDCKPAVAVAGLNSEDPGASAIAQNAIGKINAEVIEATFGFPTQVNAENFAKFKAGIPAPLAKGVEECLIRCNIPY